MKTTKPLADILLLLSTVGDKFKDRQIVTYKDLIGDKLMLNIKLRHLQQKCVDSLNISMSDPSVSEPHRRIALGVTLTSPSMLNIYNLSFLRTFA